LQLFLNFEGFRSMLANYTFLQKSGLAILKRKIVLIRSGLVPLVRVLFILRVVSLFSA